MVRVAEEPVEKRPDPDPDPQVSPKQKVRNVNKSRASNSKSKVVQKTVDKTGVKPGNDKPVYGLFEDSCHECDKYVPVNEESDVENDENDEDVIMVEIFNQQITNTERQLLYEKRQKELIEKMNKNMRQDYAEKRADPVPDIPVTLRSEIHNSVSKPSETDKFVLQAKRAWEWAEKPFLVIVMLFVVVLLCVLFYLLGVSSSFTVLSSIVLYVYAPSTFENIFSTIYRSSPEKWLQILWAIIVCLFKICKKLKAENSNESSPLVNLSDLQFANAQELLKTNGEIIDLTTPTEPKPTQINFKVFTNIATAHPPVLAEIDSDSHISLINEKFYHQIKNVAEVKVLENEEKTRFDGMGSKLTSNYKPIQLKMQIGRVLMTNRFIVTNHLKASELLIGSDMISKHQIGLFPKPDSPTGWVLTIGAIVLTEVRLYAKNLSEPKNVNKVTSRDVPFDPG